jgi:transcriptional regulator with XRE-family HTH domain
MKHQDLVYELQKDPEYQAAEKALKPYLDLAEAVILGRVRKGWSQTKLAHEVGTQQANISRIESGMANPTLNLIQRLADTLEFHIAFPVPFQQVTQPGLKSDTAVRYATNVAIWASKAPFKDVVQNVTFETRSMKGCTELSTR